MPKAQAKGKKRAKPEPEPEEEAEVEKKTKKGVKAKKAEAKSKKEVTNGKKGKKEEAKKAEPKKRNGKKKAEDSDQAPAQAPDPEPKSGKKNGAKEEKKIVTGIKKGKAMVDAKVPNAANYHVYEDAGKTYAASLMWSDLKNNNNKYYLVQLLQDDKNTNSFMVWNRWGRVGADGQFAHFRFGDPNSAKATYEKKYKEKTGKGYTEIEISYDEEEKPAEKPKSEKSKEVKDEDSSLDDRVQSLVKLIFNMKLMQKQMVEIGYDAKKMPLGKLSKDTIKKGYEVLTKISDVLDGKAKGDLMDLSSEFFTVIPHDFGFK
jgi:poly [ADP-ribose] polymerase